MLIDTSQLETKCDECKGLGSRLVEKPDHNELEICEKCERKGTLLTEAGERLTTFMRKHVS